MTERPANEGQKDCPCEHVTDIQRCAGGAKQEFSYGNNVKKWTGVEIFGDRRRNCSHCGMTRGKVTSVF